MSLINKMYFFILLIKVKCLLKKKLIIQGQNALMFNVKRYVN